MIRPAPTSTPEALLGRLMEKRAPANGSDPSAPASELEALRRVARAHRGRALELDPVGVELALAMLVAYFRVPAARLDLWRPVAGEVAKLMFDDLAAQRRLQQLWERLGAE